MSARVKSTEVSVEVSITVPGTTKLDARRLEWLSKELNEYANDKLLDTLRVLRFAAEEP